MRDAAATARRRSRRRREIAPRCARARPGPKPRANTSMSWTSRFISCSRSMPRSSSSALPGSCRRSSGICERYSSAPASGVRTLVREARSHLAHRAQALVALDEPSIARVSVTSASSRMRPASAPAELDNVVTRRPRRVTLSPFGAGLGSNADATTALQLLPLMDSLCPSSSAAASLLWRMTP